MRSSRPWEPGAWVRFTRLATRSLGARLPSRRSRPIAREATNGSGASSQEARAASALNHPGIVTIHDISRSGEVDYIVMEYVRGRTLDRVIGKHGLGIQDAVRYALQTTDDDQVKILGTGQPCDSTQPGP